jgi:caffeoyl-CoA O-methyltransferase
VRGPAGASLDAMPQEPIFDFVFMDADKTGYPDYYEQILPRMKPNALLLIDNILMGGDVVDPEPGSSNAVVAELNAKIAQDDRVDTAFAMVADGVAFVRKR